MSRRVQIVRHADGARLRKATIMFKQSTIREFREHGYVINDRPFAKVAALRTVSPQKRAGSKRNKSRNLPRLLIPFPPYRRTK